jgi:hypothetical protein
MSKRLAAALAAIGTALPLVMGALAPAAAVDCTTEVRPGSYCEAIKSTASLSTPSAE